MELHNSPKPSRPRSRGSHRHHHIPLHLLTSDIFRSYHFDSHGQLSSTRKRSSSCCCACFCCSSTSLRFSDLGFIRPNRGRL